MVSGLYLEESFVLPAKNDGALTAKLGQGEDSILPRQGVVLPPPLALCPFLLYQYETFTKSDTLTLIGVAHIKVYDKPGEDYWRINPIISDLVRIYADSMNVWYDDPAGVVWQQSIAAISNRDTDDGWKLLLKWIDVQLWRSPR